MTQVNLTSEKMLEDAGLVKLAIAACKSWNQDPHEIVFGIPRYQHWIYAAINETNHEMGRRLMDTTEYRQVLIDHLDVLEKGP